MGVSTLNTYTRSGPYSLISHSDRYLPWLSLPAIAACRCVRLPISGVLPKIIPPVTTIIRNRNPTCLLSPVLHNPGFKKLMTTPVSEGGWRDASCRTAYNCSNFVVGYLQSLDQHTILNTMMLERLLPVSHRSLTQAIQDISVYLLELPFRA